MILIERIGTGTEKPIPAAIVIPRERIGTGMEKPVPVATVIPRGRTGIGTERPVPVATVILRDRIGIETEKPVPAAIVIRIVIATTILCVVAVIGNATIPIGMVIGAVAPIIAL